MGERGKSGSTSCSWLFGLRLSDGLWFHLEDQDTKRRDRQRDALSLAVTRDGIGLDTSAVPADEKDDANP